MAKTPFEKVKSETRLLEKIEMAIPGFRGYKLRELRRESDKLLRNKLYQRLSTSKGDLKTVFQRLVDNKVTDVWTEMDRLIARLDTASEAINHASYGYSGFFDAIKIQERSQDAMLDHDSRMIEEVDSLSSKVAEFKTEVLSGRLEKTRVFMREVGEAIEKLDAMYNERRNVILGV